MLGGAGFLPSTVANFYWIEYGLICVEATFFPDFFACKNSAMVIVVESDLFVPWYLGHLFQKRLEPTIDSMDCYAKLMSGAKGLSFSELH